MNDGNTRRDFLKSLCLGTAAATLPGENLLAAGNMGEPRPNVVLIITDDQGLGDLCVKGNPLIRTPHIDAMAGRSAEMTNFYVSPVCSPTRACLMTGRYNYRTRCIDTYVGRSMMDPEEVTIAEILREHGYATGIFGKWHLGDCYPMRPRDQGFEETLVHRGGGIGQPSDPSGGEGKYTDPVLFHNGRPVQAEGYCTDVYFDRALEWIDQCRRGKRSFFAYIPTNAPHGPFHDVPEDQLAFYRKLDLSNESFPQDVGHKLPRGSNQDRHARIFSMISNIDENVGRLFGKLDEWNLWSDTIVVFMTDNGPNTRRYVCGLKGMKSHVHEGGIRSPFFVHWPGRLKAGHTCDRVAAHIDVLPSLIDACGIPLPEGLRIDGRSFLPLLEGKGKAWPDRTIYIQSHRGDEPVLYHHFAARSQKWKLVHPSGFGRETFEGEPKFELYDMENDPLEMIDVAAKNPDVVGAMKGAYERWFHEVGSTRPDNYAPPRIHVGTTHENPVVLTRQDWRHTKGRPWAADSIGIWKLHVAAGEYDIRLRFPPLTEGGEASLRVGDRTESMPLTEGMTEIFFEALTLPEGDGDLEARLILKKETKGPMHVDVARRM